MQQRIKKWGNSAAVRLPAAIMTEAHLGIDTTIDLRVQDGHIVITPTEPVVHRLDELVRGITDENRHGEIDAGEAVGNEIR